MAADPTDSARSTLHSWAHEVVAHRREVYQTSTMGALLDGVYDSDVTIAEASGTLAGFRMPTFEQGISVAGYHSHFLHSDRRRGGHALDYRLTRGTVEIGLRSELHLSLPRTPEFLAANLTPSDADAQIRRTEGG